MSMSNTMGNSLTVILISAQTEWQVIREIYPDAKLQISPFGGWFHTDIRTYTQTKPAIFFYGGWGKISAAASTQYVVDRWFPSLLVNLGTCGGFKGKVELGEILLVEKTVVYDIVEQIGDAREAIDHYTTEIDLSWLKEPFPIPVKRSLLVSGDRDLVAEDVRRLHEEYGAIAGDWESGAIAYVAARNNIRCLILRGVSDLVGHTGGEVYGNLSLYRKRTREIVHKLVKSLPGWFSSGTQ